MSAMTRRTHKRRKVARPGGQPPRPSEAVRREWLRRVEAEYRSAAITQNLTLWLIQIGAPPQLVHDGLRIAGDEMVHAELSHVVYSQAGGEGAPHLDRDSLQFPRREVSLEHDVLRCGLQVFCLGETVAVRLFSRLRESCRVPAARKALDRILLDEVRHRDFGWTLLEWMLESPASNEYRLIVEKQLPGMLATLRGNYGEVAGTDQTTDGPDFEEADRAWGLMPTSDYRQAVQLCIERDYRPLFESLGIQLSET